MIPKSEICPALPREEQTERRAVERNVSTPRDLSSSRSFGILQNLPCGLIERPRPDKQRPVARRGAGNGLLSREIHRPTSHRKGFETDAATVTMIPSSRVSRLQMLAGCHGTQRLSLMLPERRGAFGGKMEQWLVFAGVVAALWSGLFVIWVVIRWRGG